MRRNLSSNGTFGGRGPLPSSPFVQFEPYKDVISLAMFMNISMVHLTQNEFRWRWQQMKMSSLPFYGKLSFCLKSIRCWKFEGPISAFAKDICHECKRFTSLDRIGLPPRSLPATPLVAPDSLIWWGATRKGIPSSPWRATHQATTRVVWTRDHHLRSFLSW